MGSDWPVTRSLRRKLHTPGAVRLRSDGRPGGITGVGDNPSDSVYRQSSAFRHLLMPDPAICCATHDHRTAFANRQAGRDATDEDRWDAGSGVQGRNDVARGHRGRRRRRPAREGGRRPRCTASCHAGNCGACGLFVGCLQRRVDGEKVVPGGGFEPPIHGFTDRCLRPLGYPGASHLYHVCGGGSKAPDCGLPSRAPGAAPARSLQA